MLSINPYIYQLPSPYCQKGADAKRINHQNMQMLNRA